MLDIGSGHGYPASALSNFAPHPFVIDGVQCNSMEGFLQSLKYSNPEMQKHVCTLVGKKAKFKGKKKNWYVKQVLYWQGKEIDRHSQEYQDLLDRAYDALSKHEGFRKALLASGEAILGHSMGRRNPKETVLTVSEFVGRLVRLRAKLQKEEKICSLQKKTQT
jgi:predicted NAD-dependent protein-ADP-ribosyltransferase YbiA (DUF1768 family)